MNLKKNILLIEDNEADIRLMQEVLKEYAAEVEIVVARDGFHALEILCKHSLPSLIILDLNLPKKDGREVLAHIKSDDTLKSIPVIILTTSENERDIAHAYKLHANCYLAKPIDLDDFIRIITQIREFWLESICLPTNLIN